MIKKMVAKIGDHFFSIKIITTMRKLIVFAWVCLFVTNAVAQNLNLDVNGSAIGANGVVRFNDPSLMGEKRGVKVDYSDVRGSCFLNSKWSPAIVHLRSKATIKFSKLRLNLYTNDIHYLDPTGLELAADSKIVNDILVLDPDDSAKIVSRVKKYIVDGKESFFLELTQGRVVLLKRTLVTLFEGDYDVSRAKNDFRFVRKIDYYIKSDTKISLLESLSRESLSSHVLFDEKGQNWLEKNKNKLKNEDQIVDFLGLMDIY
jgi:hypothetical protein